MAKAKKETAKPKSSQPRKSFEMVEEKCLECKGTGLALPEGNLKFVSQSEAMCDECGGSGTVSVKVSKK